MPVAAVAAVVAVAVGAYVLMSATGPSGRSAQAATVSVEARHAVAMLERERQQMIAMDEASRSTQVLAAPKLASTAAPVAPKDTGGPVAPGGTAAQGAPGGTGGRPRPRQSMRSARWIRALRGRRRRTCC